MVNTIAVMVQRTTADRYGDRTPDGLPHQVLGCVVAPKTPSEDVGRSASLYEYATIYGPPGADITSTDWVLLDDEQWDVDGAPMRYRDPFGGPDLSSTVVHIVKRSG